MANKRRQSFLFGSKICDRSKSRIRRKSDTFSKRQQNYLGLLLLTFIILND